MTIQDKLKGLTDKELEIFVRQRLGQQDAMLLESQKDHFRFSFHTATPQDVVNNAKVIALFPDVWDCGDHYHAPILMGYKGMITLSSSKLSGDGMGYDYFHGDGTVSILCQLIKAWVHDAAQAFNGSFRFKEIEFDWWRDWRPVETVPPFEPSDKTEEDDLPF